MPIYEYQCEQCHHRFETLQKMSDAPLRDCPACEQPALKKLVSAAAFKLTGSGWYETDFKNKGQAGAKANKQDSDAGGDAGSAGAASGKAEAGTGGKSGGESATPSGQGSTDAK